MIDAHALPRVLYGARGVPMSLAEHEATFVTQYSGATLMRELEDSGLTGRGGAAFPTAIKVNYIREQRGRRKYVVVNAMEGEPASHKDLSLLSANPHLVLDGAELLASLIGATHVAIAVARDNAAVVNHVKRAIHERTRRSLRGPELELHTPPWRYVAGEESALVHWLDDNESLPQYRPTRPSVLRIGHGPVLLDNAETCANVALIGAFGAEWFRGLGTSESPGSTLVSVTGAVAHPVVLEIPLGTPLRSILEAAGLTEEPQAVLLGGYGGTWLDASHLDRPYANEVLRPHHASVGAGIIVVIPRGVCGLVETHRIVRWMANESARQCGPCAFGLPALAEDLGFLVQGSRDNKKVLERLRQRANVIEGRGACHHPDGVVRMLRTALDVFAKDIDQHVKGTPCAASRSGRHIATVPSLEREEELVWE